MKEMKTRKTYERPSMRVVELEQQQQLLAGSVQSMRSGYGEANIEVPGVELEETGVWNWD